MLKFARRATLLAFACAAPCALASPSAIDLGPAGKAPPRIDPLLEPFLHAILYSTMALSPDGKHIAAVGFNAPGDASAVVMFDADTLEGNLIVQSRMWQVKGYRPYARYPRTVHWLDDARIAVNFTVADAAIFGIDGAPGTDLMQGYTSPCGTPPARPRHGIS